MIKFQENGDQIYNNETYDCIISGSADCCLKVIDINSGNLLLENRENNLIVMHAMRLFYYCENTNYSEESVRKPFLITAARNNFNDGEKEENILLNKFKIWMN